MTKHLSKKFNDLSRNLSLTLEEVSAGTKQHGSQIRFTSLKNLYHGTGGTNPSSTRVFALAKTLEVPVRYLVDDNSFTPYEAVLADIDLLSQEDRKRLISDLTNL